MGFFSHRSTIEEILLLLRDSFFCRLLEEEFFILKFSLFNEATFAGENQESVSTLDQDVSIFKEGGELNISTNIIDQGLLSLFKPVHNPVNVFWQVLAIG